MNKKLIIILITIIVISMFVGVIILIDNDIQMNDCLELIVPKLTKRETTQLQNRDVFNYEEVKKIYLSKAQVNKTIKNIKKNKNWKNEKLDERLKERLEFHTREEIFYQIPEIENYYWIFTNRSNGVDDKHSVDELLEDGMYYAISFGILDTDNNVLYYYEYDK